MMINLSIIWLIIKNWWWVLLPIILFFLLKFFYLWWIKWDVWYKKNKWILLEVKPPEEILKPFKAMDDIVTVLWGIYDSPVWRERWCEGEFGKFPYWMSFEVASFGGEVHFYLRILKEWRDMVESTIYSYYPEAEISVVEDYTKNVPQNIPNEKWDLYGEDFTLQKDDVYPIKTYSMFFEEQISLPEEKRVDPMNSLLEALSKLQSGEQFWLQIGTIPIQNIDIPIFSRGRELVDKLAKRPVKKPKTIWQEAAEVLITVKRAEAPPPEEAFPPVRMRMTPGEEMIMRGVETKLEKYCFNCWIKILHLYKKDEPHFLGNRLIGRSYFGHFWTSHLNAIRFATEARTKIHYWLRDRRLYVRKRRHFRYYVERLPMSFPWNLEGRTIYPPSYPRAGIGRTAFVLSAEELATIYHFPAKVIPPTVPRVEAKKAGPPLGLPVE